VGSYKLETNAGKATLKLLPNGTLEQTVEPKDGMHRTVSGTWDWDRKDGRVTLKDAIQIDASHIGLRANVMRLLAGRTLVGRIELECDADLECAYRKE
jgi:hypothetical protein